MEIEEKKIDLAEGKDFHFPFKPYPIQIDFMKGIFDTLENGDFGIYESPTGTGKSLSLLCSSLTWLLLKEKQRILDLKNLITSFNIQNEEKAAKEAEDWISAQVAFRKKKDLVFRANRELLYLENIVQKRQVCLEKRKTIPEISHFQTVQNTSRENPKSKVSKKNSEEVEASEELIDVLLNDEFAPDSYEDEEYDYESDKDEESEFHPLKIIFASRTHSQLNQCVNELKRTYFANKVTVSLLGSRGQGFCINDEVSKLKNPTLINERCLELQNKSKGKKVGLDNSQNSINFSKKQKTCGGCPYFNQKGIEKLKKHILSKPMDIEELIVSAKDLGGCPYYASRKASKESQMILLPYNSILHSATRENIRLDLNNSVVILDEAHNLIDSIRSMYTSSVTINQLEDSLSALKIYMNKYLKKFSSENLLKLKQILHILKSLISFVERSCEKNQQVYYLREFVTAVGIEELDISNLLRFISTSKLLFKLKGYMNLHEKLMLLKEKEANERTNEDKLEDSNGIQLNDKQLKEKRASSSNGHGILSFFELLKCLACSYGSGRILHETLSLKFLLLNPSDQFAEITGKARSIVLAGGTMKPCEDVIEQLFCNSRKRITQFSCDHVIPEDNLICLAVSRGPSTTPLEFTFKNRDNEDLMQELCLSILNVSRIVPDGLVVFLPSYEFEEKFYRKLTSSGISEKIEVKKKIFREKKDVSCEKILGEYSKRIHGITKKDGGSANLRGALLLAVVGGKLSEGINFSDELGRCVIVVGLPYPNIQNIEIKEKISFISDKFGETKGKQFLTSSCFKAVNQSIGRSIRHANDYSAIILLDLRYSNNDSKAQLPNWIQKSYEKCENFGKCISSLSKFFTNKKQNIS